jgi:hypothetical protein
MAVHLRSVSLRNWILRPDAPALAVSGVSVGLLGFAHGGYFPEAWGWASIALCWCAICTVMLRESVDISIRVVWLGAGVAAVLAWSAVSLFWTSDVTNGVQSVERDGLYLSLLLAATTVCERRARVYILGGVTAGIVIVSTYAVLTRLFPDRLGVFADPQGPGRLFAPLGYWNGEAELSAIGLAVVACGCAYLRSDTLRIVAAGTVPTLSLAVFFTYSRGPILALAGGIVLLLILEPRRLSVLAWLMALAIAPAVLIVEAASLRGLSGAHYGIQSAGEGHRFALVLLAATILSAAVGWGASRVEVRVRGDRRVRRAFLRSVPIAAVAAVAIVVVVISPSAAINRIRGSFDSAGPSTQSSARLESASPDSRLALWSVAWDSLKDHPLSGEGAGSFEWEWLLHRTQGTDTRWAHSVWLEAAAEGGLPGLLVMALVLLSPFAAAVRRRRQAGVCVAACAYAVFVIHASFDWDWELPAVTVAGLWSGVALMADPASFRRVSSESFRYGVVAAAVIVIGLSAYGLAGNRDIAASEKAAQAGDYGKALAWARAAGRWQPWSYVPDLEQGAAYEARGDLGSAAVAYRRSTGKDSSAWYPWFALAQVTEGRQQADALARARTLNPESRQIAAFCSDSSALRCSPEP